MTACIHRSATEHPDFCRRPLPAYVAPPELTTTERRRWGTGPAFSEGRIQRVTSAGSGSSASNGHTPTSASSADRDLKRVRSCRDRGLEGSVTEGEGGYPPLRMRRGASYSEGGSRTPTLERLSSNASSTPSARLDRLSSYDDSRACTTSSGSTPSPCPSPKSTAHHSHSAHSSLPNFKVTSETDARLIFKSLVEAVHKSRSNVDSGRSGDSSSSSSDSSILFGTCNEPCCRPVTFFAPEMVEQNGEGVCDLDQLEIWSLGVLLYKMLTGRQPFEGKTDAKTLKLILKCKVKFRLFSWQSLSLSQEVKGLIKSMLSFRPSDRPTISEVLNHPWVAQTSRRS